MKASYLKILSSILAISLTAMSFVGCRDYTDDYKNNSSQGSSYSSSISESSSSSSSSSIPQYNPDDYSVIDPYISDNPVNDDYIEKKDKNNLGEDIKNGLEDMKDDVKDNMQDVKPKVRSKATLSTDFSEIGALDKKEYNWGPGGPVDELNRSCGATQYNKKFKDYDSYFIGQNSKNIYLTFDEGYEFGLTDDFLDVLKEKNVKAAFFLTYDFAKREPELIKRMIAEGHTLGNHSKTHRNYSTLTPVEVSEDIMFMQNYIKDNFDYEMKFFRCPSGNFNEQTLATLKKLGFKTIFWSFAYKDWLTDNQPEPTASLEKLKKSLCVGNIYLLHAVSETNLKILPDFIDYAIAEGYTFSTLDELKYDD